LWSSLFLRSATFYSPFEEQTKCPRETQPLKTTTRKGKDIPSILPLAPGGVYAVKWETRMKRAEKLAITPLPDYRNPFGEAKRGKFQSRFSTSSRVGIT